MPAIPDTAFPPAADPAAAGRLAADLPDLAAMAPRAVAAVGGNSAFLAGLARRDPGAFAAIIEQGAEAAVETAMADVQALAPDARTPVVARTLRKAKARVALAVALADLSGAWDLSRITGVLSDFASAALDRAVAHLLADGARRGERAQATGLTVLGMGKLGARELNYSSDIDLILLYDPAAYTGDPDRIVTSHARLARDLATLMEHRDADGYVFRVDYRLRPDPGSTPAAISVAGAIAYYEAFGQNWERAAMLKARPVAGDLALGCAFLREIGPFIWRRTLDFAAIADIRAMKRRIEERARDAADVLGQNVKTGPGGIREIELLVQTLQLVWGGREPALRVRPTIEALDALVSHGRMDAGARDRLARAYVFLRTVEHRLQMVADRQTHVLPTNADDLAAFAVFAGYASADGLAVAYRRHTGAVRAEYAAAFRTVSDPEASAALDLRGPDTDPATLSRLAAMGFGAPERIAEAVRGWQAGRVAALRSERARGLLAVVLPSVLVALGQTAEPDAAFARFADWIAALPAGVQPLSLLQHNPALLDRLALILGCAPSLAVQLTENWGALESLLLRDDAGPRLAMLAAEARDLQGAIDAIRGVVRAEEFALSVATLEGAAEDTARRRSALAQAALAALLPAVLADITRRHGALRGAMAVVGLGKLGGREMMHGSDLDLMIVSDAAPGAVSETGVAAEVWFSRAAHALVAALTARGRDGPLYAVDMRLRPSGNKGPVAVGLASFIRYHGADAWTWERMALTRARVVAGPALADPVARAVAGALRRPADPQAVLRDVAAMRARLARELPATSPWDLKHRAGGLMEAEFVVQGLTLAHAARGGALPDDPSTAGGVRHLRRAGVLAADDAEALAEADRVYRTVQEALRIAIGPRRPAEPSEAAMAPVLRIARARQISAIDTAALAVTLNGIAARVGRVFANYIGSAQ